MAAAPGDSLFAKVLSCAISVIMFKVESLQTVYEGRKVSCDFLANHIFVGLYAWKNDAAHLKSSIQAGFCKLRLRSTASKPVKCAQGPIVYASNNSWPVHNNYLLQKLHECASVNSLVMLKAFPNFEGSSLILAPNLRQGKRFFCVLVCCTGSAVYLAGRHLKKLELDWRFYAPKCISYA